MNHKFEDAIKAMQHDIRRILSARWLENSSVRNGKLRFLGGVLRLDSGALLDLVGQWRFVGNGAITGDVFSEGKWTQVGPWEFTGDGDIFGDVNQIGILKQGNIRLQDGKIYVGIGGAQIVIDGATGKILAGNMTIDPADGGSVTFPGGAKLAVGLTGGTSSVGLIPGGSADISVNTLTAWMRALGASISVTTGQARISAPNVFIPDLPAGAPAGAKAVLVDPSTGKLYRAS